LHFYNIDIPIEVKFIKSYLSMDGRQKTKKLLLLFLARLQKNIREHHIRATSKFLTEIKHIQTELVGVINSLDNNNEFIFELDKLDHKVLDQHWKENYSDKYRQMLSISIIKRFINLQGKKGIEKKAEVLNKFISSALKSGRLRATDLYYGEVENIKESLKSYLIGNGDYIKVKEQLLDGLYGIAGLKKKVCRV